MRSPCKTMAYACKLGGVGPRERVKTVQAAAVEGAGPPEPQIVFRPFRLEGTPSRL